ncbi:MAG: hypothetical protein NC328_02325, partial [Muribaculum sp.]|nr:hypothetical protein [Muribaculum sp.]
KDAQILMNIAFEENIFKHFFRFRKKFKSLHYRVKSSTKVPVSNQNPKKSLIPDLSSQGSRL